jgi:hypothetical protein
MVRPPLYAVHTMLDAGIISCPEWDALRQIVCAEELIGEDAGGVTRDPSHGQAINEACQK